MGSEMCIRDRGTGLNVRLGRMALNVDYAFVDYDVLKVTHQVAIGLAF